MKHQRHCMGMKLALRKSARCKLGAICGPFIVLGFVVACGDEKHVECTLAGAPLGGAGGTTAASGEPHSGGSSANVTSFGGTSATAANMTGLGGATTARDSTSSGGIANSGGSTTVATGGTQVTNSTSSIVGGIGGTTPTGGTPSVGGMPAGGGVSRTSSGSTLAVTSNNGGTVTTGGSATSMGGTSVTGASWSAGGFSGTTTATTGGTFGTGGVLGITAETAGTWLTTTPARLVIDDYTLDRVSPPVCPLNQHIWPDGDAGVACQAVGRQNRLNRCTNLFTYCADLTRTDSMNCDNGLAPYYGSICADYLDLPDAAGPYMRIAFDVSKAGGSNNDAFACYFEYLVPEGRGLDTVSLGLSQLEFWIRPGQDYTNLELSITDTRIVAGKTINNETGPKLLLATLYKLAEKTWTNVKIPLSNLSTGKDGLVDMRALYGIGFCFAQKRFNNDAPNSALSGTVDLSNIALVP